MYLKYVALYCLTVSFYIDSQIPTPQLCPPLQGQPQSCVGSVTDYQYASAKITPDGSKLIKDSSHSKNNLAFAGTLATQRGQISLTLKGHAYVNHPAGSSLFPQNAGLASALDGAISAIKNAGSIVRTEQSTNQSAQVSYFVPLFRKIQFMVLNDLYIYLQGVYSTFNMTHVTNLSDAATSEPTTALNKKSLIVSHLLNIIQNQMFFICSHHQPLVPQQLGLKVGSLMIKNDETVDPFFLLKNLDQPFFPGDLTTPDQQTAHATLKTIQSTYLNTLKTIINFFTQYTNYITMPDPSTKIPGSNALVPMATHIAQVIDAQPFNVQAKAIAATKGDTASKFVTPATAPQGISTALGVNLGNATSFLPNTANKINQLRALRATTKPINPPLLSYNAETLRALKVIPQAAKELPQNVQSVPWPAQLVDAATKGTQAVTQQNDPLGYSVAYFTTATGDRTQSAQSAAHLFINLPTANGPYAQEVVKQPAWLNSTSGILNIVRGCLGDFSQLVGKGILQECTEAIICKALGITCPQTAGYNLLTCQQQLDTINQTQQNYLANLAKESASGATS